jgi:hypothetical protein
MIETTAEQRWRLVLGEEAAESCDGGLTQEMRQMDGALNYLYGNEGGKGKSGSAHGGGLGKSSPVVAEWLGDIRKYFPLTSVQVMQKDAIKRFDLTQLLLEPELLASVAPDVNLVATLMSLSRMMPDQTKETARIVIKKVVKEIEEKLKNQLLQSIQGAVNKATRTNRPRFKEIDWRRSILANMRNYIPEEETLFMDRLIGYGRKRNSLFDLFLSVDCSYSMQRSLVYSGILGACCASMPSVSTFINIFDTKPTDLTGLCSDPVDLLFGMNLGGGTDIHDNLGYIQKKITRPNKSVMILITDLEEFGDVEGMHQRAAELVASGVNLICLLALDDQGAPAYHKGNAQRFANMGIPTFACTPDLFPSMIAAAISRQNMNLWAAKNQIVVA